MKPVISAAFVVLAAVGCASDSRPRAGSPESGAHPIESAYDVPYEYDFAFDPNTVKPGELVFAKLTITGPTLRFRDKKPAKVSLTFRVHDDSGDYASEVYPWDFSIALKDKEQVELHFPAGLVNDGIENADPILQLQVPTFLGLFWKDDKDKNGKVVEAQLHIRK
ncbi:MAG: hypothetical protein HYR85_19750 [Planctomycetes bacterium]|nr:hypothetical protein [Planctomycetota bacterium]MBI3843787.1 hypothetical protein [Planctomycetota bacterium]